MKTCEDRIAEYARTGASRKRTFATKSRSACLLAVFLACICILRAQSPPPYERAVVTTLEFDPQIVPDELPAIITGPPSWETIVVREIQRANPQPFQTPAGVDANRARLFSTPRGICVESDGSLFVTDATTGWIWKITPERTARVLTKTMIYVPYVPPVPPGGPTDPPIEVIVEDPNAPPPPQILRPFSFFIPVGIDVDNHGNIYVADCGADVVRKIGASNIVTTIPDMTLRFLECHWGQWNPFQLFTYLEADDSGNVYVSRGPGVSQIDSNGIVTAAFEWWCFADWCLNKGIAVDPLGNIYVSAAETIYFISIEEVCTLPFETGDGVPAGCGAYERAPVTYPSNVINWGVQPFCSSGSRDAALDRLGNVYVADDTRIVKFRTNRSVSILAGSAVRGWTDGPAEAARLNLATGICVDDTGNVYFTDTGNGVIRKVTHLDWDEDGVPDAEETKPPYVVGVDDRTVDTDGDGLSNAAEHLANTDPLLPDTDRDGVRDGQDRCQNTPFLAVVNEDGCSVEQFCPCAGPWKRHGEYVNCVRLATGSFLEQGLLTPATARAILREAAVSDCGH